MENIVRDQFRWSRDLWKEEAGALSRETDMGVAGDKESRDKESRFYTFYTGKPSEVFTVKVGEQ